VRALPTIDIAVLVTYLVAMAGMGLWIGRGNRTPDHFMRTGGAIPGWAVGLSIERVIGLKDSSGDIEHLDRALALARQRDGFSVLVGPEALLLETLRRGGHGGVNGGANIWPALLVGLYQAARAGDQATVERLTPLLARLGEIYQVGRHASAVVKGLKCALSLLGICDDLMAEPFSRFNEPERQKVRAVLLGLGLVRD
jgi:2-dehydro-3-deoxy-D-pentonate aldolase